MDLMIPLQTGDAGPLYEQIYSYIKREIKSGGLATKTRLPSTRTLAEHLKVSRSTTQMAYDQLLSEGYIESVPCKGYFVLRIEDLVAVGQRELPGRMPEPEEKPGDYQVDFSPRGIDLAGFPFSTWRKITRNTLVDDKKELFLTGDHQGELPLREAIGQYLHSARGVQCSPDQIIIGAGNEYLLMLLHQILGRDHTIAMENPTYRQAYRVFNSLGYEVRPVGMDQYGMDVQILKESKADIAYVMPSHQYPLGIVMPVGRRQELLSWAAQKQGRYIIEDDYDSEFRYRGKPIPALQGSDTRGNVIYIGTFSKSIAPAIRIGYLVLPEHLVERYKEKAGFYASTVSRIDQNILYQFLVGGAYERHLNRMRAIYKGKHDVLLNALKSLEDEFTIAGENAGVHLLLTSRSRKSEAELIARAKEAGVKVYAMSGYYIHAHHNEYPCTVVLGYANLSEAKIQSGIRLLEEAWS